MALISTVQNWLGLGDEVEAPQRPQ
ncbi:MAG: hypothetical protein RLZ06_539, partial [Actinomycetota bacterium]